MRVELAMAPAGPASEPDTMRASVRRRLSRYEIALLAAFAAMSLWVVAIDIGQAIANGRVWTGTDGIYIVDQMQYLAWIQSAAHHLFSANLFVLRPTTADYFQPAILISAGLTRLGVASWLALLLWKPVAVLATFLGVRAFVARTVRGSSARALALTLALFFGSFSVIYGDFGIVGDLLPGFLSWGYPFALIAVVAVLLALVSYDRARAAGRTGWAPGLFGALASALHPWQGELLILIVLACAAIDRSPGVRVYGALGLRPAGPAPPARGRLALPVATAILTAVPLVYYLILGHTDVSWDLARQASKHGYPLGSVALALAPLALVASLGYRGRPESFLELATRLWPAAALVIYAVSATGLSGTPLHAVTGITVPLSILAVNGARRAGFARVPRARLWAAAAVVAFTVPANLFALQVAHDNAKPAGGNANFITSDERDALDYLRTDPDPGGVLTQFYLGEAVPGRTGRQTFVGDCLWSEPYCMPRSLAADALFEGQLSPAGARRFVRQTGARFVLASCVPHVDLDRELGPVLSAVRRFGCATVYELDAPGRATGPLAELPPNASVRASRRQ